MTARTVRKLKRPEAPPPDRGGYFVEGGKAGPGRPRGSKNEVKQSVAVMIQTALEKAHTDGGVGYLVEQAEKNPKAFMTLVGKLVPRQVDATLRLDAGPEIVSLMQERRKKLAQQREKVINGTATEA